VARRSNAASSNSRLAQLYSQTVIKHMLAPHNWGITSLSDGYARITGPCGDTMEISLQIKDDKIVKCTFDTDGCGATVACGSIITEMATGKRVVQARRIDQKAILDYCDGLPEKNEHCALLAAHALQQAIDDHSQNVQAPWKKFYRTER
jgi:nitrogen fixation NifU-like protein